MSKSKGWAWESNIITSIIVNSIMEMGCGDNRLYHQVTQDGKQHDSIMVVVEKLTRLSFQLSQPTMQLT